MKSSQKILRILHKGRVPYAEAYALQETLHAARLRGEIPDTLLLLEHPPVFTTGRQDVAADWLLSHDDIRSHGIDIVFTNRGGRITYHGPGQLVGYFICDLNARHIGVADFVHWIEGGLIEILSRYGISAHRDKSYPGVWVGDDQELGSKLPSLIPRNPNKTGPKGPSFSRDKVAAIGLHVRHNVTLHGFALNVTTDLAPYSYCVPCGITDRSVTSLNALRPRNDWSLESVAKDVGDYFCSMAANVGSEPSPCSSTNIGHSSD